VLAEGATKPESEPARVRATAVTDTGAAPDDAVLAAWIDAVATMRDRSAFARLFAHFGPRVKGYLRRLGADDGMAEDLTQEVMLSVWRRAEQYDRRLAAPSTWVFTIARNKRIDVLRRQRRTTDQEIEDPMTERDPEPRGDQAVEARQIRDRVREAIATLPGEQAELVRIFYFEDKSHSEIAGALDLPLGTVKSRLRLALGKMRATLGSVLE
jgi:RNA polymerase sigma-70 factor (ECF subfamily)